MSRPSSFTTRAAILLLIAGTASLATAQQDNPAAPAAAHITYLTGSSVYIDAGSEEGLLEGALVEVMRNGIPVANLKVVFLSTHRASCSIASASGPLAVGDLVRFTPAPKAPPAHQETPSAAPGEPAPPREAAKAARTGGPHGRIGARYLVVKDRTGADNGFSQPALDLRLDWLDMGGGPVDLSVDVRAHRTFSTLNDGSKATDQRNRVYRAAVSFQQPDSAQRLTVGRQFTPELAALSIFDGILYEYNGKRSGAGTFAGVQPDDIDFGYSSSIRQAGAFYGVHSLPGTQRRWSVTSGLIGSYTEGTVNREFLYLQGQYGGDRLSCYVTQEVDYNRAWKVDEAKEPTVSPTSTFASFRLRASEWLTLYTGYDGRRNVRLFRDRITPVTQFDDSMRQGYWSGFAMRFKGHVSAGGDARLSTSDTAGDAVSYSGNLGIENLTKLNLGWRARSTRFTNDRSEGWLHSLGTGIDLGSRAHLELSGGRLEETNDVDPSLDRRATWEGVDLDVRLGARWYLLLSVERYDGNFEANDQGYASVTYRF